MTKILRRPAEVGLLLALLIGLLGNERCQMAMDVWVDLQAQLDSHQQQLVSQQEQICALYEASDLDLPTECITPLPCPPSDPDCDVCIPSKTTVCP